MLLLPNDESHVVFRNIPKYQPVVVVGIKIINKRAFLAFKELVTGSENVVTLDFNEVTYASLRNKLERMSENSIIMNSQNF